MALQWYALRSKPRKEDIVWKQIRSHGLEHFYPRMRVHPVNPRSRKVKPYFPGYLFVRADLEETGMSLFQWMPYALGLVSFDGQPSPVPDNLIQALKKRIVEIAAAGGEVFDGLEPGDKVRIHAGPFRGYEAVFDARLSGVERVRVLLQFIDHQRVVPVKLKPSQIRKIKDK
ncbi:MAG: transcription termination/antitermination NusG family protein [Chloroflexota bacterium]